MAPNRGSANRDDLYIHEIDRTPEYDEFIRKLTAFHEERGTSFEPEPRLPTMNGHVNVDLFKLYKAVIEKGGYDEMNKVQKTWSSLAAELGMHHTDSKGIGQLSFQLKQDFYRYLAAFWVKDQYGKEPPPRDILEQQSCASKFGPVLTRTVENFKKYLSSGRSGVETPTREERQGEGTPASGDRASGRLREAPPRRVPFQPETGPSRQPRQSSSHHATPGAAMNTPHNSNTPHSQHPNHHLTHHNPNNPLHLIQAQQAAVRGASAAFIPTNPETASRLVEMLDLPSPRPVPIRPVSTPTNNPEFAKRQRQLRMATNLDMQIPIRPAIPGGGFEGPNIYMRCLQALRSGIPAEQSFALNHLVKISFERGDKYKFESFQGLAEGLIEKALEIGSLFYHVDWQVSYFNDPDNSDIGVLDGLNGTSDILDRITRLKAKSILDHMQSADFSDRLLRITEAVLTIRNMVMLVENAIYMAEVYSLRDLLCIILRLPSLEMLVEIKHFALDIAEQLTPWLFLDSVDPLYTTLLAQLNSADRGTILTSLRAISRISMNLETTNRMQNVPAAVLQNIMNWILLNDEELVDACLDFLYQYLAVVANVESALKAVNMEHVTTHLIRLLGHGSKRVKEDRILEPERIVPAAEEVAPLPPDLHERLTQTEEPQRCHQWLQSLFEETPGSQITQIAIWQAYQTSFGHLTNTPKSALGAAEFIRTVSAVYETARASVIRHQRPDQTDIFLIQGIRARPLPVNPETKEEYSPCQWMVAKGPYSKKCNLFFLGGEKMWQHVLTAHLGITIGEGGKVQEREIQASCDWENCMKYTKPTRMKLSELTRHTKTHFPSTQKRALGDGPDSLAKRQRKNYIIPAKTMSLTWEQTLVTRDDRNTKTDQAAGIPLSAALVLCNIARNVVKTESEEQLLKKHEMGGEGGGWNERLFRPVMQRLYEVMTENKALASYMTTLLQLVQDE
ncbi:hypothetical protein F4781DRAFT_279559 [Annulohypoxylon bovei var. microspora]|nr:hypothetical protein F4781DRAFT_279559 [Annulohypoxylon bovei var. microspora]